MPQTTKVEIAYARKQADALVAGRAEFLKIDKARLVLTSGTGIEIWLASVADSDDPEKQFPKVFIFNITNVPIQCSAFSFTFIGIGAKHENTQFIRNQASWEATVTPLDYGTYFQDWVYKDANQKLDLLDITIVQVR